LLTTATTACTASITKTIATATATATAIAMTKYSKASSGADERRWEIDERS